ncbi:MAG: 2-dehydropantoate 2-reductase [Candidatus Viridilinea halotolerans]|uniref:2-dehydropantoate 2-reductase n=1 Tax=Candidatus Viridilinea halotolerans TaxID=2491704 RepID=A0A426TWI6_9CHLR|nr:MAG: 2-dehydropantoate 2-reductase [Candidatus Viridilinea halotolerans]
MRICIVGAGAIGGYLGAKLIRAGADVSLIARGEHLAVLRSRGLTIHYADGTTDCVHPALATDDVRAAATHGYDYVIVAVKTTSLAALAASLRALYHPTTAVASVQNGLPWWYFLRHGGAHEGRQFDALDPGGLMAAHTAIERVIGCVAYPAAALSAPGVIRHIAGNRFLLGEPDYSMSARVQRLAQCLASSGVDAPLVPNIREAIWVKLWGNLAINPISALTRASVDRILNDPRSYALCSQMMAEAQQIAEKLGIVLPMSITQRLKMAEAIGSHKTSMLQDIEAGRGTEVDALLGGVIALGRLTNTPTPHLEAIYACVKVLEGPILSP